MVSSFSSRKMTAEDWAGLRWFKPTDRGFREPMKMGYEFMLWLDNLRTELKVPLIISSTVRDKEQNDEAGGASNSAHMDDICNCVDISAKCLTSKIRLRVVLTAAKNGCVRFGVYENGSLHLDRTEDIRPAAMWVKV